MLFRQCILPLDMKMTTDAGRASIGLGSSDADRVIPLRNDWIAVFRHHSKIAWLQIEMHLLACTLFEVDALKSTQSHTRGALHLRELEIELHDLISRNLARI